MEWMEISRDGRRVPRVNWYVRARWGGEIQRESRSRTHLDTTCICLYAYICTYACGCTLFPLHSRFVRVPRDLTAPLPGDPVNARTHNMRVLVQFVSRRVAEYAWKTNGRLFLSLCVETPRAIAQWLIPFRPYFYLATSEWSPLDSKKSTMTTDVPNRWQHLEGTRGYLRRHVRERIAFLGSRTADVSIEKRCYI